LSSQVAQAPVIASHTVAGGLLGHTRMRSALPALVLAAACGAQAPPPDEPAVTSVVEVREIPVGFSTRVDVLFVIDDSPAMAEHAARLATQYRHMMDVLSQTGYGEPPDVRIGVVTTDLADGGRLRTGSFLADASRFAFRRERNFDGALPDAFANLASVGTAGATDTQPLAAMLRALDPGVNPGFRRDRAHLGVVILTASDDHGTAAVEDIARAVKATMADPDDLVVGIAAGCGSAPRLDGFASQFPYRSARVSLCDADLGPVVALVEQIQHWPLGLVCLDVLPVVPHDCSSWLFDPDSNDQAPLPECRDANDTHCWSIQSDDVDCRSPGFAAVARLRFHPTVFSFPATARLACVIPGP
jgi:hypothetical protein